LYCCIQNNIVIFILCNFGSAVTIKEIIGYRRVMYLRKKIATIGCLLLSSVVYGCANDNHIQKEFTDNKDHYMKNDVLTTDTATFGNGCFWCTEAIFSDLEGVLSAKSGYSGGSVDNPTYKAVCTGATGHAEVVQIIFDPSVITFDVLLEAFWASHDPTTLNRQGNDVGTQYRSVIFYHDEIQAKIARQLKAELNEKKVFPNPIVTEISPFTEFFVAENYHQDYFELNESEPYCQYVIKPKLDKFRKVFSKRLKK
jgi:peptide-methionine (S)-S-oxide reductase